VDNNAQRYFKWGGMEWLIESITTHVVVAQYVIPFTELCFLCKTCGHYVVTFELQAVGARLKLSACMPCATDFKTKMTNQILEELPLAIQ
jgi:hypothetical protein